MGALRNAKQCQDRGAWRPRAGVFPETRRFLGFFGSESQEAAVLEGNLVVGERDGPGVPYIAPERFGILAGCCNALSPEGTRTPPDQGQRLAADGDDQGCPSPGYRGFLAPLCDRGRVIEEKSVEPEVGWSLSLQGGRGPRYLHPADGLCDRWLGAIAL